MQVRDGPQCIATGAVLVARFLLPAEVYRFFEMSPCHASCVLALLARLLYRYTICLFCSFILKAIARMQTVHRTASSLKRRSEDATERAMHQHPRSFVLTSPGRVAPLATRHPD